MTVVSAKRLRTQAARCAALAMQTHDEEGRQRYLRLEQMYLELAETEDRENSPMRAGAGQTDMKPAA
jgi:hypothetical protein